MTSLNVLKVVSYRIECDECGGSDTLTTDSDAFYDYMEKHTKFDITKYFSSRGWRAVTPVKNICKACRRLSTKKI